jgi:hypothetical protein
LTTALLDNLIDGLLQTAIARVLAVARTGSHGDFHTSRGLALGRFRLRGQQVLFRFIRRSKLQDQLLTSMQRETHRGAKVAKWLPFRQTQKHPLAVNRMREIEAVGDDRFMWCVLVSVVQRWQQGIEMPSQTMCSTSGRVGGTSPISIRSARKVYAGAHRHRRTSRRSLRSIYSDHARRSGTACGNENTSALHAAPRENRW